MADCSSWLILKKNGSSSKSSSNSGFLRVKPGCRLKVRLIDNPVKVVKLFNNERKCAVLDNEETGRRLKEQYPHQLSSVSIRYACWCIDREDNKMKILDMPCSVARAFGNREALFGKKIAEDDEGCDWLVMTNGKSGKDVRYEAVYVEETPLTCSEKKMVEDQRSEDNGYYDLTRIFKSVSFEDAREKLIA